MLAGALLPGAADTAAAAAAAATTTGAAATTGASPPAGGEEGSGTAVGLGDDSGSDNGAIDRRALVVAGVCGFVAGGACFAALSILRRAAKL